MLADDLEQIDSEYLIFQEEWKSWLQEFSGSKSCKPFLKWAGGKGKLLKYLLPKVPRVFKTYHEPFVGGGALFFALLPLKANLSDISSELINTYTIVQNSVAELVADLKKHRYESEYYYAVRNVDRTDEYLNYSNVSKASRFIFLNKTCFNGLHRVSAKGYFNTPFGRYTNPTILDEQNLLNCSRALKRVTLINQTFEKTLDQAEKGDFVYFDPPYLPLNKTSSFTAYAKASFGFEQHKQLADVFKQLDKKGVFVMLSNCALQEIKDLYTGFRLEEVLADRAINSKANKRGKIPELLVRNY